MKSLKILFLSICMIYAARFIQYVIIKETESPKVGDYLDPLLVVLKTIMVTGICFSIYVKVKSENGNLQADVEIKENANSNTDDYSTTYTYNKPILNNNFPH